MIRVAFTGRSYHLADRFPKQLELADDATVDDALERLRSQLPAEVALPSSCLVSVSGRHLGTVSRHSGGSLREGDELTLIAPVAGG